MRVAVAGAHGQVARLLGRRLVARDDTVVGLVRDPEHRVDLDADGVEPVVLDLERAGVDDVTEAVRGTEAVVFAAGAGPGSGSERKDTVDRGAAVLLADAAERAGVGRYLLVSSMGVEDVRGGAVPEGVDEVFVAYLRAKLAAEDELRRRSLAWTVLRPGGLTDDPATGRIRLAASVGAGEVTRDDVAAVLVALLDEPASAGHVLELVGGEDEPAVAVQRAVTG